MKKTWTKTEARAFCEALEPVIAAEGLHVALTGDCLYGPREEHERVNLIIYDHNPKETTTAFRKSHAVKAACQALDGRFPGVATLEWWPEFHVNEPTATPIRDHP